MSPIAMHEECCSVSTHPGFDNTSFNAESLSVANATGAFGAWELAPGTTQHDTFIVKGTSTVLSTQSLSIQCRIYPTAKATLAFGIGFCPIAGLVNAGPLKLSGTTWTANGSDIVGIHYDALATAGNFHCIARNENVNAISVNTLVAPVNATFAILRVDLRDNGTTTNAYCYINGVLKATFLAAVARTTELYPYIAVSTRTDSETPQNCVVDSIDVWGNR